ARSELLKRLDDSDEERRMPLYDDPLSTAQRDLIRRWIEAGAPRGEPIATREESSPSRRSRRVRTRDIVLKAGPQGKGPAGVTLKAGPLPAVTALAFRGDGRVLAVGTAGRVVLWDCEDARLAASIEVPGAVHALAFSRDGRRLAVGAGLPARSGVVRV